MFAGHSVKSITLQGWRKTQDSYCEKKLSEKRHSKTVHLNCNFSNNILESVHFKCLQVNIHLYSQHTPPNTITRHNCAKHNLYKMLSTKLSVLEIAETCRKSNKQPSNFSALIESKCCDCCFLTRSPLQISILQGGPVVLQLRRTDAPVCHYCTVTTHSLLPKAGTEGLP